MPAISVIATVLNEAASIDELVLSLLAQSVPPSEIVIVDGGSSDGTWEMLQRHAAKSPLVHVIRDESCNLRNSPGPIARGRNVAIAAAGGEVIACCDAGCSYGPDWLARLTEPIASARAEYVLGGSCIEPARATIWDFAAAPLMGIAMQSAGVRKSCTARSMAFTKGLWRRVGGFPEETLLGEDTLFDERVRKLAFPTYAESAMAVYSPRFTYSSAIGTLARYSAADGALGLRVSRFVKMVARCSAQMAALVLLRWAVWPLLLVLVLELYFAVERDRSVLRRGHWNALIPRCIFSLSVPWVTAATYLRGALIKTNLKNPQNVRS